MKSTKKEHPNIFLNPDGSDANPDEFSFNRHIFIARKVLTTFGTYIDREEEDQADGKDGMHSGQSRNVNVGDECGGLLLVTASVAPKGNTHFSKYRLHFKRIIEHP